MNTKKMSDSVKKMKAAVVQMQKTIDARRYDEETAVMSERIINLLRGECL